MNIIVPGTAVPHCCDCDAGGGAGDVGDGDDCDCGCGGGWEAGEGGALCCSGRRSALEARSKVKMCTADDQLCLAGLGT